MRPPDPHRALSWRDPATLLLLALSVLMVLILGVITCVVSSGNSADAVSVHHAEVEPEEPLRCDAAVLERSVCPEGYFCNFDACEPVPRPVVCMRDQGCSDGCVCPEGKVCHGNMCLAPTEIVRKPKICEDERIAQAVKALAQECVTRKHDISDLVTSSACSTQDWERLAMENERFDLLLEAFPNRFAVHFPNGQPQPPVYGKRARSEPWPGQLTRAHYVAQVRPFREVLLASRQIFVIARPSPDEATKDDHGVSVQRLSFVINLIDTVLSEGVPETERAAVRRPVWSFALPKAAPLDPMRYRQTYLAPDGEFSPHGAADPMIVWNEEIHLSMRSAFDDGALLEARTGRRWQELFSALNRVVLVIPIPCLGDEVSIEKTVLPPHGPGRDPT